MSKITIAGLDGALANFGITILALDTETLELEIKDLVLVKTEKSKHKSVRVSSEYYRRANEIAVAVDETLARHGVQSVFAEIPSGGQDAKSCMAFGIAIGIYASLKIPLIEVSPSETKLAALGTRTASKEEMIEWAVASFPNAPWRRYAKNGAKFKKGDVMLDNEHLADAAAVAKAGTNTPAFRQTLAILRAGLPRAA